MSGFPWLGNITYFGSLDGMEQVAEYVANQIRTATVGLDKGEPPGQVTITEHKDGYLVNADDYVDTKHEDGTTTRVYKCPIWKYYSITYVTRGGANSPSVPEAERQARSQLEMDTVLDTALSTGDIKRIMVHAIGSRLSRELGQWKSVTL